MENSSEDDDCCIICSKTGNNSHLLSVIAKTADDINKLLNKLYDIEIVRTGNGDLRICVSCFDTVEKAATLKDCFQNRKTIFKSTREKVQDPNQDPDGRTITNTETAANQSTGCLKTTQSELQSFEVGNPNQQETHRAGIENAQNESQRYDQCCVVLERMDLTNDFEHAEIELGKANALDDFMNIKFVNDSKRGGSSKEVSQALTLLSIDELTCHCGFTASSARGFKIHQGRKRCKRASLKVRNASLYKPKKSLPESNSHAGEQLRCRSVPSDFKQHQKLKVSIRLASEVLSRSSAADEDASIMNEDKEDGLDSSIDVDDDTSPDYVANFGELDEGGATSRFPKIRRRSRPQREFKFKCKSEFKTIVAVDPTAHRLKKCDEKFECDHCSKVFGVKIGLLRHMKVHIDYQQPYRHGCNIEGCTKSYCRAYGLARHQRNGHSDKLKIIRPFACSYEGCQKSYNTKKTLIWHNKSVHSGLGPRFACSCGVSRSSAVYLRKHQQQSGCALIDPAMNASKVLTSVGNEIERVEEKGQQIRFIATVPPTLTSNILAVDEPKSSTKVKIQRAEEPKASTSMAANQYTESIDFVQPMSSFSANSKISKSKRKSQASFMCCNKDFATSGNKLKHMETAHADRKQVCGDCGKVFYQTKEFNSHMKDHTNIRQFRCTFEGCIKSYDSANVLYDHKRKNHSVGRFKCGCGFKALSKPALKKHQRKCSVGNSQKSSSEYQAEEGPPSAEQKIQTKAERKVELPQFGCDFQGCDESFMTTAELNQHAFGHAENSDRAESLPSNTVKATPTLECGCGYKTQDLGEFQRHYEVGCPRQF